MASGKPTASLLAGDKKGEEVRVWLAATNSFSLGSGLGTHCNRKRRLNARRAFLVPGGPAPRALFDGFSS